ncbi:hypothetical protein BHM03_00029366 [Ensete ventricosum]|nr:hypothetical protein BHM03_00029366 [Ensete ventricosum]
MVCGLGVVCSGLFILLLKGPKRGPQGDSTRGRFWSSRLLATNASEGSIVGFGRVLAKKFSSNSLGGAREEAEGDHRWALVRPGVTLLKATPHVVPLAWFVVVDLVAGPVEGYRG